MSAVVVDTDVVSYLFKSHPIAYQYLPDLTGRTPVISFMTVAELDRWVLEAAWGEARRKRLREYLDRFAVVPYDRDLVRNGQRSPSPPRQLAGGLNAPMPGLRPQPCEPARH